MELQNQLKQINQARQLNQKIGTTNKNEQIKLKQHIKDLLEREGKLSKHKVRVEFKQIAKITQQKGRRVLVQLKEAVQKEIERLLEEGHIEKVNEVTNKQFIQPVVITVKKRALNNEIVKDKYQMPNLEHLVDLVAEQLDNKEQEKALYTSLDMLTRMDKCRCKKKQQNTVTSKS